jgi:hypothetical protein
LLSRITSAQDDREINAAEIHWCHTPNSTR